MLSVSYQLLLYHTQVIGASQGVIITQMKLLFLRICCLFIFLAWSARDFSWGKDGWCLRLTTYHPRSAERQENPGPYPTRNPWGHLGLLWETFKKMQILVDG